MRALGLAIALAAVAAARPAAARGCHDTSFVIGRERCTRFGTWSREQPTLRLWADVGVRYRAFRAAPFTLAGTAQGHTGTDLATAGVSPIADRILIGVGRFAYAGIDLDGSFLTRTPPPAALGGILGGHAIVGAHVALGRASVGAELAGGGSVVTLSACMGKPCPSDLVEIQARRELEARVTGDVWITPRFSLGAAVGRDLLAPADLNVMIYVGGHMRAFDGMY